MSKDLITYKIIIIGDSSVGKTSFLLRFCDGRFEAESIATIGIDHKVKFISRQEKKNSITNMGYSRSRKISFFIKIIIQRL